MSSRTLVALLLAVGCRTPDEMAYAPCDSGDTAPAAGIIDSVGLAIRLTRCDTPDEMMGWRIDSLPDLDLTGAPNSAPFDGIRGVASLPDGGIVVLDEGSSSLWFFDAAGNFDSRQGGPGAGPGEFKYPFWVRTGIADSLLIFDSGHRRFTSYRTGQLELPQLTAAPWLRRYSAPLAVAGGRMLIRHVVLDERVRQPGVYEQEVKLLLLDETHGATVLHVDTIGTMFVVIDPSTGVNHAVNMPFVAYPSAVATRTGIMITTGEHFEIRDFDTAGHLRQVFRLTRRRRPVRRADFEVYRESHILSGRGTEEGWRMFEDMPLPDSMGAFKQLRVDAMGWLFAELHQPDLRRPARWVVFDPEGRGKGTVEFPAGFEVHEIHEDYLLGVWQDSLGVEHVRRYGLQRKPVS